MAIKFNPFTGNLDIVNNPLTVTEVDGAPSGTPTTLKFPNGTLTDNGDGSYTYTPAASGGGASLGLVYVLEMGLYTL